MIIENSGKKEERMGSENAGEMDVFYQDIDDQLVSVSKVERKQNESGDNDVEKDFVRNSKEKGGVNEIVDVSVDSGFIRKLTINNKIDIQNTNNETTANKITIPNANTERNSSSELPIGQLDKNSTELVDGQLDKETNNIKLGPEHFEMLAVIGQGAFGRVVQVRNRGNKVVYAMKIISKAQLERKNNISYMKSERDIMTKIDFPFIVGLRFSFQTEEKLFLVMDYLQGGELFFHLMKQGLILENTTRFYMAEIILAIEHLHSHGIIHRDLKPENVLLSTDGHIALTDFGLAKEISPEEDQEGKSRTICGTNEYMAPEMITKKGYGKAVDWWSLGTLMFEMSTGDPPFRSKNGKELNKKILTERIKLPNWLTSEAHSLLRGLLERNVEKRLGATKSTMFEIGGVTALKQHPFFKSIDWNLILVKGVKPPLIPTFTTDNDTSNFHAEFTELNVSESLLEVEGKSGTHSATYPGFSFVCPSIDWSNMVFPEKEKLEDEVSNVSSTSSKLKLNRNQQKRANKKKNKEKNKGKSKTPLKNDQQYTPTKQQQKQEFEPSENDENKENTPSEDMELISLPSSSIVSSTETSRCNSPVPVVDGSNDHNNNKDNKTILYSSLSTNDDQPNNDQNGKNLQIEVKLESLESSFSSIRLQNSNPNKDYRTSNSNISIDEVVKVEKSAYIPPSIRRMREQEEKESKPQQQQQDTKINSRNAGSQQGPRELSDAEKKYKEYLKTIGKADSSSTSNFSSSSASTNCLLSEGNNNINMNNSHSRVSSTSSFASSSLASLGEGLHDASISTSGTKSWRSLLKSNRPPNPNPQSVYQPSQSVYQPPNVSTTSQINKDETPTSTTNSSNQPQPLNIAFPTLGSSVVNTSSRSLSSNKSGPPSSRSQNSNNNYSNNYNNSYPPSPPSSSTSSLQYSQSDSQLTSSRANMIINNNPKGAWGNGKASLNIKARPFIPPGAGK